MRPVTCGAILVLVAACSTSTIETQAPAEDSPDGAVPGDASGDTGTVGLPDVTGEPTGAPTECGGGAEDVGVWEPAPGDFALRDLETGSLWNVNGQAFDGPCRGAQLAQLPSYIAMWFSWSATRHGGEIWNRDELNEPGPIEPDPSGDCAVPCDELRSGGPPPDGIPALDVDGRWNRPAPAAMISAADASYLAQTDRVLGVVIDGEARAYPHNILWWHEIHVDRIGDVEINVTFCPLTGSGLVFPVEQDGGPFYSYVSGRLYNANLTMFERDADEPTFWNQMLLRGIAGPRAGERLVLWPVVDTTWERWQQMHPDTLVTSDDTGYSRNYDRYPYDDYRTDDSDTFLPINPPFEDIYEAKDLVLSLEGASTSRAYALLEMNAFGGRVAVNDEFEAEPVLVVYEAARAMAIPYSRAVGDGVLTFEATEVP